MLDRVNKYDTHKLMGGNSAQLQGLLKGHSVLEKECFFGMAQECGKMSVNYIIPSRARMLRRGANFNKFL